MKKLFKKMFFSAAFFVFCAGMACAQGHNSKAGPGGVTITPRGINFKDPNSPHPFESQDPRLPLQMTILAARMVLEDADIVVSASEETQNARDLQIAIASLIHAANKPLAKKTLLEVFQSAKNAEGKLCAVVAIYALEGMRAARELSDKLDKDAQVSVLYSGEIRKMGVETFLNAFYKKTELFIPKRALLEGEQGSPSGVFSN